MPLRSFVGAASRFTCDADIFLDTEPTIKWQMSGKHEDGDKYILLMIDPDAPNREGNGTLPGRFGPWVHMLKVNCRNSADTCNEVLDYVAPKPPNWSPPHRYIFILFEQLRAGRLPDKARLRTNWNLKTFIEMNAANIRPYAINFFYASFGHERDALFYDSIDSEARGEWVQRAAGAELGGDDQRKDEL